MTAWELQLCANGKGKATATLAWLSAGFARTKKLKPLASVVEQYDPKIAPEVKEEARVSSLYAGMMAMVQKSQDEVEGASPDDGN